MVLLKQMLSLAKPDAPAGAEPKQQSIFSLVKEAKDPTGASARIYLSINASHMLTSQTCVTPRDAAAMKKNFRLCQTAVTNLVAEDAHKLLLSMVEQPQQAEFPEDEPPPVENMPDDVTQYLVRTAFDNVRRKMIKLVEDLSEADLDAHKAEIKAKDWQNAVKQERTRKAGTKMLQNQMAASDAAKAVELARQAEHLAEQFAASQVRARHTLQEAATPFNTPLLLLVNTRERLHLNLPRLAASERRRAHTSSSTPSRSDPSSPSLSLSPVLPLSLASLPPPPVLRPTTALQRS